ncbi:IS3 family transposase [Allofournierella massiliensis]|uniref:IS3 family transposase n=1 Tax=Allofournierella massiliensis TaxID=1650663 RepID=UPI0039A208F6
MCKFFGVSRSGCYAFVHRLGRPEQDAALAEVIAKQQERSFRMNRDFHASKPNSKWVTDISYIHTRQGVLYLSMIRDLYDNSIVACKTGTEQTVNLVLDTIRLAMKQEKEKVAVELQLHSDQGAQYASQAYFKLTQTYGITPSMSRRGTPYDNAMAENFCSILKTECIYRHKPATFSQANELIAIFTSTTMSASS